MLKTDDELEAPRLRTTTLVSLVRNVDTAHLRMSGGSSHAFVAGGIRGSAIVLHGKDETGTLGDMELCMMDTAVDGIEFEKRTVDAVRTLLMTLSPAGQLKLPITGSGAGLLIGGDVNLYRRDVNKLTLAAGNHLEVDEIYLDAANRDIRLHRKAADVLGLDDHLDLGVRDIRNAPGFYPYYRISTTSPEGYIFPPAVTGDPWGTDYVTANHLYASYFVVHRRTTFNRMRFYITAGYEGSVYVAIYNDDGYMYPGSQVGYWGPIDIPPAGEWKQRNINVTLNRGVYWLAIIGNANFGIGYVGRFIPAFWNENGLGIGMWYRDLGAPVTPPASFGAGGTPREFVHAIGLRVDTQP